MPSVCPHLTTVYFTTSQYDVATSSFIPMRNHQATDTEINKLTIIVLESADLYLPDRVEFKHTSLLNLRQDMTIPRVSFLIWGHFRRISDWMLIQILSVSIIINEIFPKISQHYSYNNITKVSFLGLCSKMQIIPIKNLNIKKVVPQFLWFFR